MVEPKLEDRDIRGGLRLLVSDDTIATYDEETRQALFHKHPPHHEPTQYPQPLDPLPS